MIGDLFQPLHLMLILVVALLVFGPRRLPELGSAVGKTIREFQKSMSDARSQLETMTTLSAEADQPKSAAPGTTGKPN